MIDYQGRWAVVTGASSGLGRGLAAGLADRGMSLVLTGRNEARLDETTHQIRRAAPSVKVETVAADLSSRSGVSTLLDHVGDRSIEVLVNNAGFGSYGPFAEADPDREADEVAVDVGTVVTLARAFLPGMLARGSGGILNVASTIAFQPAPYQAVYRANKAFVLSFSQALWAEARAAGVAVTALCPGPTRTGFVDALGADAGHTAIYRRLADPEPVIKAGLLALDKGRAVVIPGVRNKVIAASGRFMPHEWLTRVSARLLRPASAVPRPPIEVHNEIVAPAAAERVWDLLTDVEGWPSWYRACRWVRVESTGSSALIDSAARPASFRWKAHPIALRSTVVASDRPYSFAFIADARGLHAEHTFTLRPAPDGLGTVVLSHETQAGPLPRLGRVVLGPRLHATTQAWLADLARAVHDGRATQATPAATSAKEAMLGHRGERGIRDDRRPHDELIPEPHELVPRNRTPDTIAGWKAVADGLLSDPCCAFHRNVEISSRYAWISKLQPACFKWAAMAEHEQRALVQPNFDRLSCASARLVSIGSATSFEVRGVRQEVACFTSFYLYSLTRGIPHALRAQTWPRITRFDDRWRWLVTSVVPQFRRFDADTRLVNASLRRILEEAHDFASTPCVLPRSPADRRRRAAQPRLWHRPRPER